MSQNTLIWWTDLYDIPLERERTINVWGLRFELSPPSLQDIDKKERVKKQETLKDDKVNKFEQEKEAFFNLKEKGLLEEYKGKFVAIVERKVVDSDEDERVLVKRIYSKYGYIPFYSQKVQDNPLPILEVPTPERGEV